MFFSIVGDFQEIVATSTLVPILELFYRAVGNKGGAIVLEAMSKHRPISSIYIPTNLFHSHSYRLRVLGRMPHVAEQVMLEFCTR